MDIKRLRELAGVIREDFEYNKDDVDEIANDLYYACRDGIWAFDGTMSRQTAIMIVRQFSERLIADLAEFDDEDEDDDVAFTGRDSMSYMNDR